MHALNSNKRLSKRIRRTLFAAAIVCITLSLALAAYVVWAKPAAHPITPHAAIAPRPARKNTPPVAISAGLPLRMKIPALNIDAAIEYVGLTSAGAMDIKPNQDDVAWYKLGPRPGEKGSAVIAGHYGWDHGKASVFTELSKLQPGDKIYIDNDKKTTLTFVVRDTKKYDPNADTTGIFHSNDGKSHLNLITCDGTWNAAKQTYSHRFVVFSDQTTLE